MDSYGSREFQYFNNTGIASRIRSRRILTVPGKDESYPNPLTNFDMDVADAVYTIFRYEYHGGVTEISFTLQSLYDVLIGSSGSRITGALRKALTESIDRMEHTFIEIRQKAEPPMILSAAPVSDESFRFLKLDKEGLRYIIRVNWDQELHDYRRSFMPLYVYADLYPDSQFVRFSTVLLSYGAENHRSVQYIQLRRLLIRRLEWERYYQNKKLYGSRDIKRLSDGSFVSRTLPVEEAFSPEENRRPVYRVRLRYQRKTHLSDPGSKAQRETGLLPQLGIMAADYPGDKRYLWRQKKFSVHGDVCRILDDFKELKYIGWYEVVRVPASYGEEGIMGPPSSDRKKETGEISETALKAAREKRGWERERLAEEVTYLEFVRQNSFKKNFVPEDFRRQEDETLDEWLNGTLREDWEDKYRAHLRFIRNREEGKVPPRSYEKQRIEWEMLAEALTDETDGSLSFSPEDLREKEENLAIYGVTVYKPAGKTEWTKRLKKLKNPENN